ncbi:MAG TPA: VOC family protein [Polyangiaceae bacterium]|nr:VOC family protein [Polyangiaceae bacterium]HMR78896.1 VOC family protein [Polyangiaceae bacterium]
MSTYTPGRFIWHEIFTSDVEKTKAFYSKVAGWTTQTMNMTGMDYTMFLAGEEQIGGIMSLAMIPTEGVPPHWLGYVSVPNVDEAAAATKSGGGTVLKAPEDIPNMGRFAVLQDPQGAVFAAFKGNDGDQPEVDKPKMGTIVWDHLNTSDVPAALKFYEKVFAWKAGEFGPGMPVFKRSGDKFGGGLGEAPPGSPPHWLAHILVKDLAAARKLVTEESGKVLMEEIAVPNIGKFAVIQDNVGAVVALFQDTNG